MDDYFAKKFHPLQVCYVIGRSYKAAPECEPDETLFDAWKDLAGRRLVIVTVAQFAPAGQSRMIFGAYRPERRSREMCTSSEALVLFVRF